MIRKLRKLEVLPPRESTAAREMRVPKGGGRWTFPRPILQKPSLLNPIKGVFDGPAPLDRSVTSEYPYPGKNALIFSKRRSDAVKSQFQTFEEMLRLRDDWNKYLDAVEAAANAHLPAPGDVDLSDLETLVCRKATGHRQADEKGRIGSTRHVPLTPLGLELAFKDIKFEEPKTLTNKTGTLISWPVMSSLDRMTNGLYVAGLVAVIHASKRMGMTLESACGWLTAQYGPPFVLEIFRNQDTSGNMPTCIKSKWYWWKNFVSRIRSVRATPKLLVLWNKRTVTILKNALMELPEHTQVRSEMQAYFDRAAKSKHAIQAKDFSAYDMSILGIQMTEQIKRYLFLERSGGLLTERDLDDLLFEDKLPSPFIYKFDWVVSRIKCHKDSGNSDTTVDGIMLARVLLTEAFFFHYLHKKGGYSLERLAKRDFFYRLVEYKQAELKKAWATHYGKDYTYLDWSDDCVVTCSFYQTDDEFLEADRTYFAGVNASIDAEPTIKYLGHHYLPAELKQVPKSGMSWGRFIIKTVSQERSKTFPFSLIGHIDRCGKTDDPAAAWAFVRSLFRSSPAELAAQFGVSQSLAIDFGKQFLITAEWTKMSWPEVSSQEILNRLMREALTYTDGVKSLDNLLSGFLAAGDFDVDDLDDEALGAAMKGLVPALSSNIGDLDGMVRNIMDVTANPDKFILPPDADIFAADADVIRRHLDATSLKELFKDSNKMGIFKDHLLPAFKDLVALAKSSSTTPTRLYESLISLTAQVGRCFGLVQGSLVGKGEPLA